jgi:2-dehydro-3-deoxyphosphogluconate aldolase / (4S)-4-hydroxy-2-oxoglutarate aldolase
MERLTRQEIYLEIKKHRFIPLFHHDDIEVSKQVLQALYDGGVRVFEFTNRSTNALNVFKGLVDYKKNAFPEMLMGAGTILSGSAAQNFHEAGADFIISPNIPMEVGSYCESNNIFWCPGASTLNEILLAENLGADMVKIFPANFLGGPGYLKALRGPCPDIKVLITGGVEPTKENLMAWFDAGAIAIGMGGNLFDKEALKKKDFQSIADTAAKVVGILSGL